MKKPQLVNTRQLADAYKWSHTYTRKKLEDCGVKPKQIINPGKGQRVMWDYAQAKAALDPIKDEADRKRAARLVAPAAQVVDPAPEPQLLCEQDEPHPYPPSVFPPLSEWTVTGREPRQSAQTTVQPELAEIAATLLRIESLLSNHLTQTHDGVRLLVSELSGVATALEPSLKPR
jgi:hypothetical protein